MFESMFFFFKCYSIPFPLNTVLVLRSLGTPRTRPDSLMACQEATLNCLQTPFPQIVTFNENYLWLLVKRHMCYGEVTLRSCFSCTKSENLGLMQEPHTCDFSE